MLAVSNQIRHITQFVALLCCLVVPVSSFAATNVGKIIITTGKVTAVNAKGEERKLKRRSKIFSGDTINVAGNSRAQIRFIDKQLVALQADTVFRIDEYKFKDKADGKESAAMSLLKGGMRSVTGVIGKKNKKNYKVRTPVATLGVRGTHYVLQLCVAGSCGPNVEKGLYGSVVEGAVVLNNPAGQNQFGADQFFHVPSLNAPPVTITVPPSIIVSNQQGQKKSNTQSGVGTASGGNNIGGKSTGGDNFGDDSFSAGSITIIGEPAFVAGENTTLVTTRGVFRTTDTGEITLTSGGVTTVINQQVTGPAPIIGVLAPTGSVTSFAGNRLGPNGPEPGAGTIIQDISGSFLVDAATGKLPVDLIFVESMPMMGECQPCSFTIFDDATISEAGSTVVDGVNVNWGRWNLSSVQFFDSGVPQTLLDDLSFVFAESSTTPAQLAALSSAMAFNDYALVAGPAFRDESGGLVTGSVGFSVDFAGASVFNFNANLTGADGRIYSAFQLNSLEALADLQTLGIPLLGTCTNGVCGQGTSLTGNAGAVIIGPNGLGAVGGFDLMNIPLGIGVSGTGVFVGTPGGA